MAEIGPEKICLITGSDNFSEDVDGVDNRAVPSTSPELVLALVDGQQRPLADGPHIVDIELTYATLRLRQPGETVADR